MALAEAGLRSGEEVYTSDEMRLGLRGVVRRVVGPTRVTMVIPPAVLYKRRYLLFAVNTKRGEVSWRW